MELTINLQILFMKKEKIIISFSVGSFRAEIKYGMNLPTFIKASSFLGNVETLSKSEINKE